MLIEKIIRKLKNKPDYTWDSRYSFRELFTILTGRLKQVIRGLFRRWFFRSIKGILFMGSKVTIKHNYLISAGSNLILEDNVYINALSTEGIIFKNNVSVARNTIIICTGIVSQKGHGIIIGNNCGINAGCYLAGQGGIEIGDNVIIGPAVKIFSENHNFSDPDICIKDQGVSRRAVAINDNCWIGAGATILAGVTIGAGSVIAAGAIVTRSIAPNSIVGGVPGKTLKKRIDDGILYPHGA